LGGDFGLVGPVYAPEGGWIAGLLKSLHIEWNRHDRPTAVKICDFSPADAPETIVEAMLQEMGCGSPEVEVGLGGGRRRIVRAVPTPVDRLPRVEPQRGSTWLVTGGARGITAEVAIKLGRDYAFDLHLIGRSEAPRDDVPWRNCSDEQLKQIKRSIVRQAIAERKSPEKQWDRVKNDIEIYNNLERMRKLGLRVTYHSCDVSNWGALDELLQAIRRVSGPITGIIHGAGYARTSRFETQKRNELSATIGAKVDGALALMQLTQQDPVRFFVGFGSISGRFGGNGLSDYAAANEMLAKLCAWFSARRGDCAVSCIEWQSWDEVGMAMLPDSAMGTREVLKMKFIPPAEGVEHLGRELCAGLPEREVLIDDGEFERLMRASDRGGAAAAMILK
jgi:NAD(P)-dependent dehydrogenase (short-subunit alcohol dehydrogenase family)